MDLLVVTAVAAERRAVLAGLGPRGAPVEEPGTAPVHVAVVGVGPAMAAAVTAWILVGRAYRGVVSAGVGGGFAGRVAVGGIVVATASVAADLGAESPDGFIPIEDLGFGTSRLPADPALFPVPGATVGEVLTVSTVTGTVASTDELLKRHPAAVAEGMEGYGVATAAARAGIPFAEIRAISNLIGPRDRSAWRLDAALGALTTAFSEGGGP